MRLQCEDFAAAENDTVIHSCHYHTFPHPMLNCVSYTVPFQGSSQLLSCIVQHVKKSLNSPPPPPLFPLYLFTASNQKQETTRKLALTPGMSKILGKRQLQLGTQTAATAWVVSVPDPKPTPAWIAFSTGSDIRAG